MSHPKVPDFSFEKFRVDGEHAKKAAKNAIKVGEKASEESGNPFPYKSMIETEMAKW